MNRLAWRLLSAVAAAENAGALDEQLRDMLREAFEAEGRDGESIVLGNAIEDVAIALRDS